MNIGKLKSIIASGLSLFLIGTSAPLPVLAEQNDTGAEQPSSATGEKTLAVGTVIQYRDTLNIQKDQFFQYETGRNIAYEHETSCRLDNISDAGSPWTFTFRCKNSGNQEIVIRYTFISDTCFRFRKQVFLCSWS